MCSAIFIQPQQYRETQHRSVGECRVIFVLCYTAYALNRSVEAHFGRSIQHLSVQQRNSNVGRFAYKSFRLHDVSCFAYTSGGDSPTRLHGTFTVNNRYKCDQHLVYITIYRCDLYRIVRVLNCKGTIMIKSNPSFVLSNCSHPVHVGSFVFM